MKDYFRFLRSIPFFSSLSDSDIKKIEGVCEEKYFKTGDIVFIEDSLGDNFFIILEGSVEIWKDYKERNRDPLAIFSQGQLFGELALIDNFPRSATVVAREPCRLLSIHRDDFTRIITESGSISLSIMKSLSSMLRESTSNFLKDMKARNRYLEKAYKQLKKTDEQRVTSLREKEILLNEFHHWVKSNMQIISDILNIRSSCPENSAELCSPGLIIDKTKEHIRVMTLIHEILFQSSDILKVNAESFIYKLIHVLFQNFVADREQIQITIKTDEIFLAIEDAVPVGLIINELVGNAFQHAFPDNREGEIKIMIYLVPEPNHSLELLVSDNGAELPYETNIENTGTMGLCLVKRLTEEYLKGRLAVIRENGTCFVIRFIPKKT